MKPLQTCEILKTNIAVTNMGEASAFIENYIMEQKKGGQCIHGNYICISNVHTTVMSYEQEHYRRIQNSALAALPDGKPLSSVSRRMGFAQAERVAGPDLMEELFRVSEEKGYRHYFYGSTQHTIGALRQSLRKRYPGLCIAGMEAPPFYKLSEEEDAACVGRINQAKPDIVWVGLGAPKQEIWMYEHRDSVHSLMIGVGAGFDFHAGTVKRAPAWMQNIGLEWLYRLCQDPKRLWKRYLLTNGKFIRLAVKQQRHKL